MVKNTEASRTHACLPRQRSFSGHIDGSFNLESSQTYRTQPTKMGKAGKKRKRRERDKPKAAPDAVYNPNKRVLLSYASDDDNEGGVEKAGLPPTVDRATAERQRIPQFEEVERDADGGGAAHIEPGSEEVTPDDERVMQVNEPRSLLRKTAKDPMTGQWPALGSMLHDEDDQHSDAECDSTEEEAMAYLRAVR